MRTVAVEIPDSMDRKIAEGPMTLRKLIGAIGEEFLDVPLKIRMDDGCLNTIIQPIVCEWPNRHESNEHYEGDVQLNAFSGDKRFVTKKK